MASSMRQPALLKDTAVYTLDVLTPLLGDLLPLTEKTKGSASPAESDLQAKKNSLDLCLSQLSSLLHSPASLLQLLTL